MQTEYDIDNARQSMRKAADLFFNENGSVEENLIRVAAAAYHAGRDAALSTTQPNMQADTNVTDEEVDAACDAASDVWYGRADMRRALEGFVTGRSASGSAESVGCPPLTPLTEVLAKICY